MIKFYRISFTIFYKNNILIEYKHPAISCFLSQKKGNKKKTNEVEFHKFELVGALSKFRVFFFLSFQILDFIAFVYMILIYHVFHFF